jgi:benzylsuccinate CoA-transferase BbsF subunit
LIDISQFETAISFILPGVLDYAVNGKEPERIGNASPAACPHGIYRCQGDDRWCTIVVTSEEEWQAFCSETGMEPLAKDPKFKTFSQRKANEAALDEIITAWTSQRSPEEVMERLQKAGVAAGVVENIKDVLNDPQLKQRNLFWKMNHPEMGEFTHLGESFMLSKTPSKAFSPSPLLGGHTEQICTELLGMKDDEFVKLMADGVFE